MKKLVFATILFCSVSISAFANNDNSNPKVKVNESEAPDCKDRGGVCLVVMNLNGYTRTYKLCCCDVIVIGQPGN